MIKYLLIGMFMTFATCGGSSGGGDEDARSLREELENIRATFDLPALGAVLLKGNTVFESAAVGVRAVGHPELVTSGNKWHLGSLTKSMTATLAARLVEQGTITWDTKVSAVFPGMIAGMRPEYVDVTLEQLLSHTSGLPEDIATAIWNTLKTSADPLTVQRRNWAQELLAIAPAVTRGTYLYSNGGYIVAGSILEEVTGIPWETLIEQDVFTPLGMTSTGFGPPGVPGVPDQPWGHSQQAGTWIASEPGPAADNPAALGPAGTVHSTFVDYARYMAAHLRGAGGGSALLSSASFSKLHKPAPGTDYALGWGVFDRNWGGGQVFSHAGSNTLWYAIVWLAPNRDFAMLAVTNAAGATTAQAVDDTIVLLINRYNDSE